MKATLFALAHRGFESGAGLVTLFLVGAFFTAEERGFYYTFVGLLTLQTLVDLGFASVVQQFASHECARGGRDSRLPSLVRFSLRWYAGAGAAVGLGLWFGGALYFGRFSEAGSVTWRGVWLLASLVTGASLLLTPLLAIIEGAGQIERAYRARLAQSLAGRVFGWLAILSGLGLAVVPITRLAALAAGVLGLGRDGLGFLRRELERDDAARQARLSWRHEMWPLQWRIAVSTAGGYLLFSLFTPVVFAARGAEAAGRMGMSLSVATALSSAGFAFIATVQSKLAMLAARREYEAMDTLFRRRAAAALVVAAAGALAFLAALEASPVVRTRFLPLSETAILLTAVLLQQGRFAMASYLRAHKEEPFAGLAALEGAIAVAVLGPLGARFGSLGIVTGFLGLSATALVPAGILFLRRRDAWRAASLVRARPGAEAV